MALALSFIIQNNHGVYIIGKYDFSEMEHPDKNLQKYSKMLRYLKNKC